MRNAAERQLAIQEYPMRVEGLVRAETEDITAQVIRAYSAEIEPNAKTTREFIANRETLVEKTKEALINALIGIGSVWVKAQMGLPPS